MSDSNDSSQRPPFKVWHDDEGILKDPIKPEYIAWVTNLLDGLKDGGYYGMPRSGLFYTKTGHRKWRLSAADQRRPELAKALTEQDRKNYDYYRISDFHYMYHLSKAAGIDLDESEIANIPLLAIFITKPAEPPRFGAGKTG